MLYLKTKWKVNIPDNYFVIKRYHKNKIKNNINKNL